MLAVTRTHTHTHLPHETVSLSGFLTLLHTHTHTHWVDYGLPYFKEKVSQTSPNTKDKYDQAQTGKTELQSEKKRYYCSRLSSHWGSLTEIERQRETERDRETEREGWSSRCCVCMCAFVSVQVNRGSVKYSPYAICQISYVSHWHFPTFSNNVKPPRPPRIQCIRPYTYMLTECQGYSSV